MKKPVADPRNTTGGMPTDQNDDPLQALVAPAPGATGDSTTRAAPRRGFLKSLGGSSLLTAAGLFPAKWAKPVVESVVLPAHAQTSSQHDPQESEVSDEADEPDEPDEPDYQCDTTLTIDDVGPIGCNSPGSAITRFIVDDTGDCPIVTNDIDDPGSGNVVEVVLLSGGDQVLADVRTGDNTGTAEGWCGTSETTPGPTVQFASYNGSAWLITFTLVVAGSTATVTDIEVSPA